MLSWKGIVRLGENRVKSGSKKPGLWWSGWFALLLLLTMSRFWIKSAVAVVLELEQCLVGFLVGQVRTSVGWFWFLASSRSFFFLFLFFKKLNLKIKLILILNLKRIFFKFSPEKYDFYLCTRIFHRKKMAQIRQISTKKKKKCFKSSSFYDKFQ